jgi:hypothetical protein
VFRQNAPFPHVALNELSVTVFGLPKTTTGRGAD